MQKIKYWKIRLKIMQKLLVKKNKYISKMVNKFLSKNALTGKNIQEIKKIRSLKNKNVTMMKTNY